MSPIPLTLEHKDTIAHLCTDLALPLSEYNFANLYLFREIHQYRLIDNLSSQIGITGVSYDHQSFFMPLYHPTDWAQTLETGRMLGVDSIFPIPEMWFEEVNEQGLPLSINENDIDYLYDAKSIREYRGRHFDGHRNFIRQLRSDHEIVVSVLEPSTRSKALSVIDGWLNEKPSSTPSAHEAHSCREAVELADELGLEGWVYELDGRPGGLLIGGPLTKDVYLFHFSKALPLYRGLSKFIFQDAAQRINQQYTILNWEQDLGDEGLRHSKQSYHPAGFAKKGTLPLVNQNGMVFTKWATRRNTPFKPTIGGTLGFKTHLPF